MEKPELKKIYEEAVVKAMMKSRGYKNRHEVPALEKIIVSSGIKATEDKAYVELVDEIITSVTGQKAVKTKAKKSISNFKLREGMPNGVMVTLRGGRMYDFLYRFIVTTLPSIRDFRGIPSKMDGHGNYNMGINDHTIFPESIGEAPKRTVGMNITIVTSAKTDDEGRELLSLFGMPFRGQTANMAAKI